MSRSTSGELAPATELGLEGTSSSRLLGSTGRGSPPGLIGGPGGSGAGSLRDGSLRDGKLRPWPLRGGGAALRRLVPFALGTAPGLALLGWHQLELTGQLFGSVQLRYYALADGPPGCFGLGVGPLAGFLAGSIGRAAADRLGWTLTKYNRKLDNLCAKFEARGVRGLHGASDRLANNRRARLVEYAISAGLVTRADLAVLP